MSDEKNKVKPGRRDREPTEQAANREERFRKSIKVDPWGKPPAPKKNKKD